MGSRKINFRSGYFKLGLTIFLSGLALILCAAVVGNLKGVADVVSRVNGILTPFYLGIIMAYLLCPVYNAALKWSYRLMKGSFRSKVRAYRTSRLVATVAAFITLIVVVGGLVMLVIPDFIDSVITLVRNLPEMADRVSAWVQNHIEKNPELVALLQVRIEDFSGRLLEWAEANVLPGAESLLESITAGIRSAIGGAIDMLVALIICIYVLNSKEIFQAQAKKFILASCSKERADSIFELGHICNDTFGGFINGKIIDSFIIGIICFIVMTILKLPLAMLISVIVGVTNIIPFFGPFIGAIPSGVLLLCLDPWAALKFIIMILVLQQIDGNIIGPKILGKATKLASFWVMFAIIVGGGLFGFVGMILGVPTMAILYIYLTRAVNGRLRGKDMPAHTAVYENFDKYGIDKEDIFGKINESDGKVPSADTAKR